MGDIYDSTSYQPRKSVGYLLSRVRIEMLTALDRELEADRRLAPPQVRKPPVVGFEQPAQLIRLDVG